MYEVFLTYISLYLLHLFPLINESVAHVDEFDYVSGTHTIDIDWLKRELEAKRTH